MPCARSLKQNSGVLLVVIVAIVLIFGRRVFAGTARRSLLEG